MKPTFGTCAGAILLATEVENPSQTGLGALDIRVRRNAYGRQLESSIRQGETSIGADDRKLVPLEMVFIRAPKIERVGDGVEVLATIGGVPRWQFREIAARDGSGSPSTLEGHFGLGVSLQAQRRLVLVLHDSFNPDCREDMRTAK